MNVMKYQYVHYPAVSGTVITTISSPGTVSSPPGWMGSYHCKITQFLTIHFITVIENCHFCGLYSIVCFIECTDSKTLEDTYFSVIHNIMENCYLASGNTEDFAWYSLGPITILNPLTQHPMLAHNKLYNH